MDTIPENYDLQTIEQIRALADELRVRIVKQLTLQAMTVTQLAELFNEAPNKLHYHVRELERVGLLKKVETREKGGVLEKYYRAVARNIEIPKALLGGMPPDEATLLLEEIIQPYFQKLIKVADKIAHLSPDEQQESVFHFSPGHYWMTREEFSQFSKQVETLLQPYERARDIAQEHQQTVVLMAYTTATAASEQDSVTAPAEDEVEITSATPLSASRPLRPGRMVVIGVVYLSRNELEDTLAEGKTRNVYILGNCTFADDISPELVERAIASFRIKGKLNASPAIREVLKRKGGPAEKKKG